MPARLALVGCGWVLGRYGMAMSFLHLEDKTIAVIGLANRKSVAHAVSRVLLENGARVLHIVRDETIREDPENPEPPPVT